MRTESLIIIGTLLVIVPILIAVFDHFIFKYSHEKNIKPSEDQFSNLYNDRTYDAIKRDSCIAGKWNSPFIKDKDIISIVEDGMNDINMKNIFQDMGDCNERPNW